MIGSFVKKAINLNERNQNPPAEQGDDDESDRGANWEDSDNVKYCRICDSKFEFAPLPPVKRLWKATIIADSQSVLIFFNSIIVENVVALYVNNVFFNQMAGKPALVVFVEKPPEKSSPLRFKDS
jgi:hypothetical protein